MRRGGSRWRRSGGRQRLLHVVPPESRSIPRPGRDRVDASTAPRARHAPWYWGTRDDDLEAPWPALRGEGEPAEAWLRAVDVAAPAPWVFRWLCQLRAAPYSYDWIDNAGRRSPRELTPGLERLEIGQSVMRIFELVGFEPGRSLSVATRAGGTRIFGRIALTYRVLSSGGDASRLAAKLSVPVTRSPVRRAATLLLAWGDLVMMRKQLLTLKQLAESTAAPEAEPR